VAISPLFYAPASRLASGGAIVLAAGFGQLGEARPRLTRPSTTSASVGGEKMVERTVCSSG